MSDDRIIALDLDEASLSTAHPDAAHERKVAIYDLLQSNSFKLVPKEDGRAYNGPYKVHLRLIERRLQFHIRDETDNDLYTFLLSLTPLKRVIKDYFLICDSYYEAIRTATPSQIEAVDMGRRGLHNEGSELLLERLEGKVEIDHDTSRRLFTVICALHNTGDQVR